MLISEFHFFNMDKKHASIFANIIRKMFVNMADKKKYQL